MKMYVRKEDLNEKELKTGKVSYKRVVERYIGPVILCNNIENLDESIFENIPSYDEEDKKEIFQYYLCNAFNVSEFQKDWLAQNGVVISYSDMLECDVLMVTHCGTSWDDVITNVEWTENLEEC